MINISELITDQDFCQPSGIHVKRSVQTIVNHKVVNTVSNIVLQGIITLNENEDLLGEHSDMNVESIKIFTHERLKTVGKDKDTNTDYGADIVVFNGAEYIVRSCLNDSQYGFCKSVAYKLEQNVE